MAIVRLVWTLATTLPGAATPVDSKEPGLDVFRRQRKLAPGQVGQWI